MVLLVIDTQKLIMTEALYNFEEFKSNVKNLIKMARENDREIIYIKHDDGPKAKLTPGKEGFEIFEDFKPNESEKVFIKKYNSVFKETKLDEYLKKKNIKNIIVCGLQTDLCIDATIKSGFERGYNVHVVSGCNTTVDNNFLTGRESYYYYNNFIWKNRYANIIEIEEIDL